MSTPGKETIRDGMPRWPTTLIGWCGLLFLVAATAWFSYKNQLDSASVVVGIICWMLGMDNKQAAMTAMAFRAASNSADAASSADEARHDAHNASRSAAAAHTAVKEIQNGTLPPDVPDRSGING